MEKVAVTLEKHSLRGMGIIVTVFENKSQYVCECS